ncbi:hypothetical protein vseg_013508 [Gypsophila vaccaria]
MASIKMVMAMFIIFFLSHNVDSQLDCNSMTFSNKKSFTHCKNLPTLGAILHWTYDELTSTLSMAFTAPSKGGWIAWALNPTGTGMVGSQALMAYKSKQSSPLVVHTTNVRAYHAIEFDTISYSVSNISSEESFDNITIFGTWALKNGPIVNMVWQVGPILMETPQGHALEKENLNSKLQVNMFNGVEVKTPIDPNSPTWSEASAKKNGALEGMVSIFCVFGTVLFSFLVLKI